MGNELLDQPDEFVGLLEAVLTKTPLPGVAAQQKMSAANRIWTPAAGETPRQSAVLALLHPSPEGVALLFTLRPARLAHHGGQVSFPGGGREESDITLTQTALRETQEELGLDPAEVRILGPLTWIYIASSRNMVYPFVGWIPRPPKLFPNVQEVAEVLAVPLRTLLDPSTVDCCVREVNGQTKSFPSYHIGAYHIWGATAMMTSELLEIVRRVGVEA
ncbi:MAG TPA: CoA pyrophosphatase [Anaerolineae bacterium]|nr:CoA pyrophosphatase [Anaerolineae bacterium]HQK13754.1 CoA pyrophosphatase [Anaerolineae bacterium]